MGAVFISPVGSNLADSGRWVTEINSGRTSAGSNCLENSKEIPTYSFLILKQVYEEILFVNRQKGKQKVIKQLQKGNLNLQLQTSSV